VTADRFAPRGGAWPVGLGVLSIVAATVLAIALVVAASRPSPFRFVPREVAAAARGAERTMKRAAQVIQEARRAEGIPSEAAGGSPMSTLIGAELTPITTTLGNLEAKRVATSAAWAGALTVRLHQAGLRRGDTVAAGFSGSFPGLNLALVIACQALDLKLLAVSSVTASSWGANQPGFTWPEIEARLVRAGVIGQATIVVTLGGAGDRALDLDADGRAQAGRVAKAASAELSVPVFEPGSFDEAVAARLEAYRRAANGHAVELYANVGGTEASLGRSPVVLRLPSGFLPGVPFDFSRNRGVMARFAERGVRVLTLLNVRDLALRWGIL
jgi:poly-gamma-glutamate system protein